MSEVVLTFPLMEGRAPVYQRFAPEIRHLWQLGLSRRLIAKTVGVNDKTVAKSLATGALLSVDPTTS